MKPGFIQVFDGLRITTQHMNHLQGSFHSALHDIRQILGAGKVHSGFEVVKEGNDRIAVMPGLAFDFEKNRIVCSEPKIMEVRFQDIEETQYVCVKYTQVEKGVVEGKPTLIYDSCSILILNTLPDQNDNIIPIASLIRKEEDETFEIVSLLNRENDSTDGTPTSETKNTRMRAVNTHEEKTTTNQFESSDDTEVSLNIVSANSEPLHAETVVPDQAFSIRQGVLSINPDKGTTIFLENEILEFLDKIHNEVTEDQILRISTLKEVTVPLNFSPISLTVDTLLEAELELNQDGENTFSKTAQFHATGHGEATLNDDIVSQYGVASIQSQSTYQTSEFSPLVSEITQEGIFQVPFRLASHLPDEWTWLKQIRLNISTMMDSENAFRINSSLVWKGGNIEANEELVTKLQQQETHLRWGVDVAWKALGVFNPQ